MVGPRQRKGGAVSDYRDADHRTGGQDPQCLHELGGDLQKAKTKVAALAEERIGDQWTSEQLNSFSSALPSTETK